MKIEDIIYPQHQILKTENHRTQALHDFMEWAEITHGVELRRRDKDGHTIGLSRSEIDLMMAEWIGVDLKELEAEKRDMLDRMRMENSKKS